MLNCYVNTATKAVRVAGGIVTPRARGSTRTRHRCTCTVNIDAQIDCCTQEEKDNDQAYDFAPRFHALSL